MTCEFTCLSLVISVFRSHQHRHRKVWNIAGRGEGGGGQGLEYLGGGGGRRGGGKILIGWKPAEEHPFSSSSLPPPFPHPRCKMLNHATPFNVPKCNLSGLVTSLLCLKSDEYINRARENLGP